MMKPHRKKRTREWSQHLYHALSNRTDCLNNARRCARAMASAKQCGELRRQLRSLPLSFVLEKHVGVGPSLSHLTHLPQPLLHRLLRVALIAQPHIPEVRGGLERRRPLVRVATHNAALPVRSRSYTSAS